MSTSWDGTDRRPRDESTAARHKDRVRPGLDNETAGWKLCCRRILLGRQWARQRKKWSARRPDYSREMYGRRLIDDPCLTDEGCRPHADPATLKSDLRPEIPCDLLPPHARSIEVHLVPFERLQLHLSQPSPRCSSSRHVLIEQPKPHPLVVCGCGCPVLPRLELHLDQPGRNHHPQLFSRALPEPNRVAPPRDRP
ncbi:hypothetical protein BKA80DRAFT_43871 [Phyllosticta citrichinensis]